MSRAPVAGAALALVAALARPAAAQLPDAATFLADIGFDKDQVAQVDAGSFVDVTIQPSSEREIAAAFAFLVQTSPSDLVNQPKAGLIDETGFGGGAKRSIGSKLLSSQLEALYQKVQAAEKKSGG